MPTYLYDKFFISFPSDSACFLSGVIAPPLFQLPSRANTLLNTNATDESRTDAAVRYRRRATKRFIPAPKKIAPVRLAEDIKYKQATDRTASPDSDSLACRGYTG